MILSDEIPIGVSAQNVDWDSSNNLKQVLGNVDIDNKGDIQQQIDNISSLMTVPDSELSSSSTNAVQNRVVKQALDKKADKSTIPKNISELTNDAGFLTSTTAPVTSVNGYTGEVSIDLSGLDRIDGLEDRIAELENTSGGDDDDQSITIDSELLDSQNPVQNRVIKAAFNEVDNQFNHINQVLSGNSAAITAHEDRIDALELRPTGGSITIDNTILANSTNPVQNRVIKEALDTKADLSEIPAYTSQLTNDSGFLTSAPVTKVNGQTGDVVIPQASTSVSGLMAAADKVMLNKHESQIQQLKISGGSSSITVDSALSDTSTNPVQNKIIKQALDSKAGISIATTSVNGLMSSADKTTLDSYESRITALENNSGSSSGETPTITIDSALSSTSMNPVQNKIITQALNSKASNDIVSINSSGLMSAQDKIQLNNHEGRIDLIENTLLNGSVVTVDATLSSTSQNPIQNKAIKAALDTKANISTVPVISMNEPEKRMIIQNGSSSSTQIPSIDIDSSVLEEYEERLTQLENRYVTPEMYGAVGDGLEDDTEAMSQAFNSGSPVYLTPGKEYYVDSINIIIPLILIGNFATISTKYSDSTKSLFTVRPIAKEVIINNVNFTTTVGVDTVGAHGETITNRSKRTCITSYGVDKISIINCTMENFDEGIIGITSSSDSVYANVPSHLYVKDTKITNVLMGISRLFKHVVVEGCYIKVGQGAQSGEHCLYFLTDVLTNAYVADTTLITAGSSSGSCAQFYPRNGEPNSNLVNGVYRIDGCTLIGDAYVSTHGGGKCYVTASTLKTQNYNTTNKRRQLACPSNDDSFIDVTSSSINLECQDGVTERIIYRGCNIYSNKVLSGRFAIYKAYNCQFDNIGINLVNNAEIIGCIFASSEGVAGKYYISASSSVTAASIMRCIFKTGTDVNYIAHNSEGKCDLISIISSLPNGNNIPNLVFYHKINPSAQEENNNSSSSTDTVVNTPKMGKAVFVGDSIGQGFNNNDYSFVNILDEDNFFEQVTKNCHHGDTTFQILSLLSDVQANVEEAEIVYISCQGNDINAFKNGTTSQQLANGIRTVVNGIRSVNATCVIVWLPLSICHFEKLGKPANSSAEDLTSYYKQWANAAFPVFAQLGVSVIPIYDMLTTAFAVSDGRHPNNAGHRLIANLIKQNPYGYTNFPTVFT